LLKIFFLRKSRRKSRADCAAASAEIDGAGLGITARELKFGPEGSALGSIESIAGAGGDLGPRGRLITGADVSSTRRTLEVLFRHAVREEAAAGVVPTASAMRKEATLREGTKTELLMAGAKSCPENNTL